MENFAKWALIKNSTDDKVNLLYISYFTTFIVITFIVFYRKMKSVNA